MTDAAAQVDQPESHDSDGAQDKSGFLWIFWLVTTLLLAYPLSIGPVVKYYRTHRPVPDEIVAFYRPLEALDRNSSTAHKVFKFYLHLWGVP